jgi:polysaccharide biosynthesis/export protein
MPNPYNLGTYSYFLGLHRSFEFFCIIRFNEPVMKLTSRIPYGKLVILFAVVALLSSCVTQKQVKYLQKLQKEDTSSTFANKRLADYRIQTHDNLYIRIFSMDEKSYTLFNKQSSGYSNDYINDAAIYLNSYSVDDSGYIVFPLVGKLYVKDLTIEQSKNLIQAMVNEYLKETSVVVKMVNFNVTVVGEVRRPGEIKVYQDKINLFEILSLAGDLTDFADRGKVTLIRQTVGGSKVVHINLNSEQVLTSDYYYMRPNDILYVAPLGVKRWGFETFPWVVVFSAISTSLLLINYFK